MPTITTIVTAYRRPQSIEPLVAAIRRQSVPPTSIWCWANDPNERMKTVLAKAELDRVVICSDNARFHGRFALALLARTEFVAIFDDDSIPGDQWFANCLETMAQTPGILGTAGVVLHEPDYGKRTMHGWQRPCDKPVEVDLVGQAWFLRTEWIKYLFADPPLTCTNGEDIELAARAWRLAGIRSFCPPHPADDTRKWGSTRGLELGLDEVASSHRVEHLSERRQIVEAEIEAGWKLLFMRGQGSRFGVQGSAEESGARSQESEEGDRLQGTGDSSLANPPSADPVPPDSRHHAPRDDSRPTSPATDVAQPPAPAVEGAEMDSNISTVTECCPKWVTQYSYPIGSNGEATTPARVSLRLNDGHEESWCLDCIDEIESLGDRDTAGAAVPNERQYDKIECGAALERVRDPLAFLRRAHRLLKPGGELTASVSNVSRQEVVERLIHGRWVEEKSEARSQKAEESLGNQPSANGVSPTPPLRFFTLREVEKLFYRAGFKVAERIRTCSSTKPGEAARSYLSAPHSVESKVEHYRFTVTRATRPCYDLTSIIIVTHNQLTYTRACLESIRFLTDEPYELIVVDNGSTDGTVDYLRSCPDVKLIENAENRGFPAAANQGIRASAGAQVLLLNNDVLVTTGWLRRMLEALEGTGNRAQGSTKESEDRSQESENNPKSKIENPKSRIGLVGPLTNNASGYQEILVSYGDTCCLDGFAWEHAKQHDGQLQEVDRLIGFCLLIRREVIDQIGLLDERFGIGNYEDDDYCRRAHDAGWKLAVARDSFIHHFGHRTFDSAGVDLNALLIKNRQVYDEKWAGGGTANPAHANEKPVEKAACQFAPTFATGVSGPPSQLAPRAAGSSPVSNPPVSPSLPPSVAPFPPSSLIAHPSSLILSLCMIVRNNAGTIRPCLESIKPWSDEMIVVDTGSTDATADICRQLGAQVYHFPWPDSFSIARNESLKYARGEWIFWMDSDDVIDAENGRKLRELAYRQHDPKNMGYIMQVHCPGKGFDGMHDVTVVDHLKLFRNRPDLRFEGRIHEQIMEAITRAGGDYVMTNIFVVHAGADRSPEGWKRKLIRDIKLLRLDLRERPNHPFVHFNFGMTYLDVRKYRKAIKSLRRSLELSPPEATHVRKVYAMLVICHRELGERAEARRVCAEGLKLFPNDAELLFRHAMLLTDDGRFRAAELSYRAAMANNNGLHIISMDAGIVGFKARHNLAGIYSEMGALHKAEEEWRKILADVPTYRDGWRGLFETLVVQGKLQEAAETADQLMKCNPHLRATGLTLSARIAEKTGQIDAALVMLRQVRREYPDDVAPLEDLGRLLFLKGEWWEAEATLRDLVRHQPTNGEAYHNLGTLLNCSGRYWEAAEMFRASLRARPVSALTQLSLGYALSNIGKRAEAGDAFEQCVRLAPEPRLVAEAQRQLAALAA